jgi:type II secretory ATPase GspE/PulE/Tfp pilus assembly ATPase PilB-like protein
MVVRRLPWLVDIPASGGAVPDLQLVCRLPIPESFSAEYLEYYRFLPLELTTSGLRVAVAGEPHAEAMDDLQRSYNGAALELVTVSADELQAAIRQTYSAAESMVELVRDLNADLSLEAGPTDESTTDIRDLANQPPVIRFVNLLIREAHEAAASDIHLEATRDGMRVRLRIDGVLSELPGPTRALQAAVVSRIKLLAELDIAERRQPQDGRIRVRLESRELDLRVSTVPTLYGESVVLRLLDHGGRPVGLDDLGMPVEIRTAFQRLAGRAHGILLATGPTGSGKTTTLYAALGLRHPTQEKVITVEDPVEYHLPDVTQVPVHHKTGLGFAAVLRSILRQDPDVLMVGEMRDQETAQIAIQAAMTGHLVLSTLHTQDAAGALTRLADLKVEPYMIAATVEGVLAQRLVRRICADCRERYRPDPAAAALIAGRPLGSLQLERGRGCAACRETGYRGRTGIFELLVITDELRQGLTATLDPAGLRQRLREHGMRTLRDDAWAKVQAGVTTVEEVLRVVQS